MSVPTGSPPRPTAYQRFLGDTGPGRPDRRPLRGAGHRRRPRAGRGRPRDPPRRSWSSRFPPALEADIRAAYEQLAGGRRRGLVRGALAAPPPRTCPTPRSPGSRRPSSTCAASTRCCRPSARSSPRSTTTAPSPTGCTTASTTRRCRCRPACSGWCARDVGASGVMFTHGHRVRLPRRRVHHLGLRAGRGGRAGRGQPRRVLRLQARAARPGARRSSSAGVGEKATKMVYTEHAEVGRTIEFVDVDPAERRLLSLTDDEVAELARQAVRIEEHYGRPMDIEWGKDGVDGQALHPAGAPGDRAVAASGNTTERYRLTGARRRPGRGPGDRAEDRRRRRPGARRHRRDGPVHRRATCSSPT